MVDVNCGCGCDSSDGCDSKLVALGSRYVQLIIIKTKSGENKKSFFSNEFSSNYYSIK